MPSGQRLLLRSQTDERLAALAAHGSEQAFVTLVERHRRLLFATALRLVPAGDADDLVQQGLLRAWSALRDGTSVQHPRAWLVQIVRNTAVRHLARHVEAEDLDRVDPAGAEDAYAAFHTRVTLRETLANVARLPEAQRVALVRSVLDGVSQQEIAVQLGTSEGGVRQLLYRARHTLRAAATAVTPWPLLLRLADLPGGAGTAAGGAAGGAGLATKVAIAVLAVGAAGTADLARRGSGGAARQEAVPTVGTAPHPRPGRPAGRSMAVAAARTAVVTDKARAPARVPSASGRRAAAHDVSTPVVVRPPASRPVSSNRVHAPATRHDDGGGDDEPTAPVTAVEDGGSHHGSGTGETSHDAGSSDTSSGDGETPHTTTPDDGGSDGGSGDATTTTIEGPSTDGAGASSSDGGTTTTDRSTSGSDEPG
jgi:RNA polymerase sigma factor (sigma-70 family)